MIRNPQCLNISQIDTAYEDYLSSDFHKQRRTVFTPSQSELDMNNLLFAPDYNLPPLDILIVRQIKSTK